VPALTLHPLSAKVFGESVEAGILACWLMANGGWRMAYGGWLIADGGWWIRLSAICHELSAICYRPSAICQLTVAGQRRTGL